MENNNSINSNFFSKHIINSNKSINISDIEDNKIPVKSSDSYFFSKNSVNTPTNDNLNYDINKEKPIKSSNSYFYSNSIIPQNINKNIIYIQKDDDSLNSLGLYFFSKNLQPQNVITNLDYLNYNYDLNVFKSYLNYQENLFTKFGIEYYKGKSFRFFLGWLDNRYYFNDGYNQDWILYENNLLVCNKNHLSNNTNKPKLIYNADNKIVSLESNEYWSLVMYPWDTKNIYESIKDKGYTGTEDGFLNDLYNLLINSGSNFVPSNLNIIGDEFILVTKDDDKTLLSITQNLKDAISNSKTVISDSNDDFIVISKTSGISGTPDVYTISSKNIANISDLGTINTASDTTAFGKILSLEKNKQDKYSSDLITESKEIVNAINEIKLLIPVKLSSLINDSGYIVKSTEELINYYKKSEIYTKQEIDAKISNNGNFDPDQYYNKIDISKLLINKVDKVSGMGLSSNDYTLEEKTKLLEIDRITDQEIDALFE